VGIPNYKCLLSHSQTKSSIYVLGRKRPLFRRACVYENKGQALHKNGWIWRYTGTPCTGESCPGWQRLDDNPKTKAISASGSGLYQLHNDGWIWLSTGTPCTGDSCPGWQRLDNNPKTRAIAVGGPVR
jgi:hypothetical protein